MTTLQRFQYTRREVLIRSGVCLQVLPVKVSRPVSVRVHLTEAFLWRSAMSLDKAIKYKKEKRKPYRGAKLISPSCRNHGSCPYCRENRLHKFREK